MKNAHTHTNPHEPTHTKCRSVGSVVIYQNSIYFIFLHYITLHLRDGVYISSICPPPSPHPLSEGYGEFGDNWRSYEDL